MLQHTNIVVQLRDSILQSNISMKLTWFLPDRDPLACLNLANHPFFSSVDPDAYTQVICVVNPVEMSAHAIAKWVRNVFVVFWRIRVPQERVVQRRARRHAANRLGLHHPLKEVERGVDLGRVAVEFR